MVCDAAQEAASLQQKRGNLQHYGATFDMLLSDILDHYRTFGMLERYLKNPSRMASQLELQIASHTQALLIEKSIAFTLLIANILNLCYVILVLNYRLFCHHLCCKLHCNILLM